jgi:hypothetical protein
MALRERPAFSLVFGIVKRGIEDWGFEFWFCLQMIWRKWVGLYKGMEQSVQIFLSSN